MEGYVNVAEKCVVAGCDILLIPSDLIGRRLPKSTKSISLCFRTSKRRSVASVVTEMMRYVPRSEARSRIEPSM